MENTVIVTESNVTVRVIPQVVNVTATVGSTTGTGGGGGVTDHGDLTGLADDDHTQYLNNARGDVRYAPIVHTHVIADVTGLQTALDGKAATSHTHPQSDITNLTTDLAGKQDTLVSGTNIRTVNGTSLLGSGDVSTVTDEGRELLRSLGLSIIAESFGRSRSQITAAANLADTQTWWAPIRIDTPQTITGIGFYQSVQGVYTADNENRLGLYTLSGGTFTRVAVTANDGNLWKGAANSEQRAALTTPYSAAAGVFWVVGIYNQSAQTTAPSIGTYAALVNAVLSSAGLTGGNRTAGFLSGQSALAATYTAASVTNTTQQFYFFVY